MTSGMEVTGFFTAIIIGLIIGALGRLVVPGKQNIPIWLTLVIGIVAAILGTLVAAAIGVADTRGVDWIELALQVAFAAVGVAIVSGAAYDAIAADMVDMETYAVLRAAMRFSVPLIGLRGISDGRHELRHYGDWHEYLHVVDERLSEAVDTLAREMSTIIRHSRA